jgi:hypothetical protein
MFSVPAFQIDPSHELGVEFPTGGITSVLKKPWILKHFEFGSLDA